MMMKSGDRIEIVEHIDGDNTPIGTQGTIQDVLLDGTVVIELDGYPEELYYTSEDGGDFVVTNA